MKRVGLYLSTIGFGGLEIALLDILSLLDRSQFEPVVYLHCPNPAARVRLQAGCDRLGVAIRSLDAEGFPVPESAGQQPSSMPDHQSCQALPAASVKQAVLRIVPEPIKLAWFYAGRTRAGAAQFRKEALDVIHFFHGRYPSFELPIIASRLAGIPVRISDVGCEPVVGHWSWVRRELTRLAARSATTACVMNQRIAKALRRDFRVAGRRIRVLFCGVEAAAKSDAAVVREIRQRLGLPAGRRLVTIIGRLSPEKWHRGLLHAAAELRVRHPEAHYLVIGDGPLRRELEEQAKALGIKDQVMFTGFRDDVPLLLAASDLAVISSLSEGGPWVLLEAMAAGKPVIATDVGFVPEVLKAPQMGRIVPPGNVAELVHSLDELLSADAEMLDLMGRAARAHVQQLPSRQQARAEMIALYDAPGNVGFVSRAIGASGLAVGWYRLTKSAKRRLGRLVDAVSPGWGLRKRFPVIERFAQRIERPSVSSAQERYAALLSQKTAIAHVRCDAVRFRMKLDTRGTWATAHVTRVLLMDGIWEPQTSRVFCQALRPGMVVLDLGANVGYFSLLAGRLVGAAGRVLAFEPDPRAFDLLCANICLNGLSNIVIPIQKAVGHVNAQSHLFLSSQNPGDQRLFDSGDGRNSVPVDCVRVDDYLASHHDELASRIGLIKMDLQGFEPFACRGMERLLRTCTPSIITEYEPELVEAAGTPAAAYVRQVESYGYAFSVIPWQGSTEALRPMGSKELLALEMQHVQNLYCTPAFALRQPA